MPLEVTNHPRSELVDFEMFGGAAGAYAFIGSVLEASTEYSMIATDPQGMIVLWNEGARRSYGYEPGEIIGRHKSVLHAAGDVRTGVPDAMMAHASAHGKWEGTVERARKDGTTFTARVVMTMRHGADGQPIGFLLMSSDITDELRRQEELAGSARLVEAKAEQLAISLKYKSEFFANMSHELRTPLSSMLILSQLLETAAEIPTSERVRYASAIHSAGASLLRVLNGVLDLAQVESGIDVHVTEWLLCDVRDALQREANQIADHHGVSFAIEMADDLPSSIATDPRLLRQVFSNLLANAFKFTADGAVNVHVGCAGSASTEALSGAGAVVAFSVSDTGIGMTADTQRRIFDDFVQGDGSTSRSFGGAGLGLSIAKKVVALLGGEIVVASTPGLGSIFTVYLPAGNVAAEGRPAGVPCEPQDTPAPPPVGLGAGLTALVVDDDAVNVFALTAVLERASFAVVSAESGQAGIAILERASDIDVALVDIMMPVLDGYATIAAMHELPFRRDLPILAVTAKMGVDEPARCINAGASAYISKPIDTDNLLHVLRDVLPARPLVTH